MHVHCATNTTRHQTTKQLRSKIEDTNTLRQIQNHTCSQTQHRNHRNRWRRTRQIRNKGHSLTCATGSLQEAQRETPCATSRTPEGARKSHERSCTGREIGKDGRRDCGRRYAWITYENYARHVRGCARREGERNDRGARGRVKECNRCGRVLTVANMARHQKGRAARGPGWKPSPWRGR